MSTIKDSDSPQGVMPAQPLASLGLPTPPLCLLTSEAHLCHLNPPMFFLGRLNGKVKSSSKVGKKKMTACFKEKKLLAYFSLSILYLAPVIFELVVTILAKTSSLLKCGNTPEGLRLVGTFAFYNLPCFPLAIELRSTA